MKFYRDTYTNTNLVVPTTRGQLAVAAVAAGAYLPLYNELEKFKIS